MALGSHSHHKVVFKHSAAHISVEQERQSPKHFLLAKALAPCYQRSDLVSQLLVIDQLLIHPKHLCELMRIIKDFLLSRPSILYWTKLETLQCYLLLSSGDDLRLEKLF